jgi:hypothetical protein
MGMKISCVGTVKPAPTSKRTHARTANAPTSSATTPQLSEAAGAAATSAAATAANPPPTTISAQRSRRSSARTRRAVASSRRRCSPGVRATASVDVGAVVDMGEGGRQPVVLR